MSLVYINCPICNNCEFNTFKEVFDDRYGEPNKYNLAKCLECKHIITFPRIESKNLGKLYEDFYPRNDLNYRDIIKRSNFKRNICFFVKNWFQGNNNQGHLHAKKGERVLDIGCGDCSSLLQIKKLGAKPYGIETDFNVKKVSKDLNLKVHIGNIEDNPFQGKLFDLIVLNQVIEHIPEPHKALEIIKEKLSPNGRIIIVVPNNASLWKKLTGFKLINWHIPYHLHHFNKANLKKMLQKYEFKIINIKTITPNIWTILQIRHFFHNVKIGEVNKIWNSNKKTRGPDYKIQNYFKIFKIILKSILFTFIGFFNRIIDFFNFGDSLMIEVKIRK